MCKLSNEYINCGVYSKLVITMKNGSTFTCLIDSEDKNIICVYNWTILNGYAARCRKPHKLHRFVMNPENNQVIDHINRNRLDNRKSNLRIAGKCTNQLNRLYKVGKSGYRGVTRAGVKWSVNINVNGKSKYLGRFEDIIQAAKVYNENAIKYHKELATLNKI